jgi:hypothetical protein
MAGVGAGREKGADGILAKRISRDTILLDAVDISGPFDVGHMQREGENVGQMPWPIDAVEPSHRLHK